GVNSTLNTQHSTLMLTIDFSEKKALITGGSRGVGRATALMFARAGADVGFSYYIRHSEAESTLAELRSLGVRAFAQAGDLSDPVVADMLADRMANVLGG